MKKILALALAAVFVLSMLAMMVACGSDKDDKGDDTEETSASSGNSGGAEVNGITLPDAYVFLSEDQDNIVYMNMSSGEAVIFGKSKTVSESEMKTMVAGGEQNGNTYVFKSTEEISGKTAYVTSYVTVNKISADEYEISSVTYSELDSSRPLASQH